MAITYNTTLKNARLDEVITAIGATGKLVIGTAGMATVLAIIDLANPAAPAAASGTLTFTMPQSDTSADSTGTAAAATITDGTTDIITGLTVGLASSDIILDSVSITAGQTITINSATITHG